MHSSTRGFGLLESVLAKKRAEVVNGIIPNSYRSGRILDIGCGVIPYFLQNTEFAEKYGSDKSIDAKYLNRTKNNFTSYDVETIKPLPFSDDYFDVITMLAVIEHIETANMPFLIGEIYRTLRDNGLFIFTTPSKWADGLLRFMANIRLVSPVEIEEHKELYTHKLLRNLLMRSGFSEEEIKLGYFELHMNIVGAAKKTISDG